MNMNENVISIILAPLYMNGGQYSRSFIVIDVSSISFFFEKNDRIVCFILKKNINRITSKEKHYEYYDFLEQLVVLIVDLDYYC